MKIKKSYINITLLILILSLTLAGIINQSFKPQYKLETPKSSAGEITIITPENKTYTKPDSGYYPATYGFENDENGSNPTEWELWENGGTIDVVNSIGGHLKVVEISKDGTTNWPSMRNGFPTSQASGTVEFWMRGNDVTDQSLVYLRNSGGDLMITVGIDDDYLLWSDSSVFHNLAPCYDNVWYHIRIDFECGSGAYEGLSADHFYIYINGERYGEYEFRVSGNSVDYMHIFIWETSVDYNFDAIGYSWDPNYNIGDNLNEGLLLSYENATTLDWQGYSLDGQANKTILGNTTIPMPADGSHSIQVFGNDTLGNMYESSARYFTTNAIGPSITVNSPLSNELWGKIAPSFVLTILDGDLNATWYSLDGGTTNVYFTGLSGTIDQAEWNKIGNGTATFTIYANDTFNNVGQSEVTVRKDIIAPIIIITDPSNTEEFEFTSIYDITVSEPNLDEIWYTIDGGTHNYTITETVGTINLAAWNLAPSGPVTLRFYARDLAGNVGMGFVIVVKTSAQQQPPPGIPGYDLYILLGALSLISILIIKKRLKS